MLNLIFIIAALLVIYIASVIIRLKRAAAKSDRAPTQTGKYSLGSGKRPFRFLLIGDSIAAANGIGSFEKSVGGLLAEKLADDYRVTFENRAQNGAKLADIRKQLSGSWDLIVIMGGSNDLIHFRSNDRFRVDLSSLLKKARSSSKRVVFAGPGNVAGAKILPLPYRFLIIPKQKSFQGSVQEEARHHGALAVSTGKYNSMSDPKLVASDRLHPSAAGHKLWFDMIWPLVDKLVQKG